MKFCLLTILCLFSSAILSAQSLYPVKRGHKWGFVDSAGTVVIPLQFDAVQPFTNTYAPVLINGQWGVIGKSAQWIYGPQFDGITPFSSEIIRVLKGTEWAHVTLSGYRFTESQIDSMEKERYGFLYSTRSANPDSVWENRRRVESGGKYGYIDSAGLVIPYRYDDARPFYKGLAAVNLGARKGMGLEGGLWGVIDSTGKTIVPILYEDVDIDSQRPEIVVRHQQLQGLYARNGSLLAEPEYARAYVVNDSMLLLIRYLDGQETVSVMRFGNFKELQLPIVRSGLLSFSGDTLLPFIYRSIHDWSQGRFLVEDSTGYWGVVSLTEGVLLECRFGSLEYVGSNILIAGVHDDSGPQESFRRLSVGPSDGWRFLIDHRGREVLPGRWRRVRMLHKDLPLLEVEDEVKGKGVIHLDGRVIVPQDWYDRITFRDGLIELIKDTCAARFINADGSDACERCFIDIEGYSPDATVATLGKRKFPTHEKDVIGLIDSLGNTVVLFDKEKADFRSLDQRFHEGLLRVTYERGRIEFINPMGKTVLGPYGAAERFSEGLAAVAVQDGNDSAKHLYGFVDRDGRFVIPPKFDSAGFFREGLAPVGVKMEGDVKWGFIDRKGKWIIKPRFGYARPFSDGLAVVLEWTDSGVVVETWGCLVADERYDRIGAWGAIDRKGKTVIPATFDYLYDFHNDAASAHSDSGAGIIDRSGNWLAPPEFAWIGEFTGELAPATLEFLWFGMGSGASMGYIERNGRWVISPRFQQANPFYNGRATVTHKDACRDLRYVNAEGETIWQE